MGASSGLSVTAALLCLQFHPITKAHTYTGPTPPSTNAHAHRSTDSDVWGAVEGGHALQVMQGLRIHKCHFHTLQKYLYPSNSNT